MLATLQLYIFREMGKVFLLTAVSLMIVLSLGGSLVQVIDVEQISAWQVLKLMTLILPVSLALTLPIAAMFSAAAAYGRLSADNEFVACRSGGINILRLFRPALAISLFSAVVTFVMISYVIPGILGNLAQLFRADIEQLVAQTVKAPGGATVPKALKSIQSSDDQGSMRLTADQAVVQPNPDDPSRNRLLLEGVVYVEMDVNNWSRFASARTAVVELDDTQKPPVVRADVFDVSIFDFHNNRWANFEHQPIGPFQVPLTLDLKAKWLDLTQLFHYRRHPYEFPEIRDRIEAVRAYLAAAEFYRRILSRWQSGDYTIELGNERLSYEITADKLETNVGDGRPYFLGDVVVTQYGPDGKRIIRGKSAVVIVRPGRELEQARASIRVTGTVTLTDPRDADKSIEKTDVELEPFLIDREIVESVKAVNAQELLAGAGGIDVPYQAEEKLKSAIQRRDRTIRKITSAIHTRICFSVSVFVLVILAAALGIIFRGAHLLVAFGVAFVPALFAIIMILAGKSMVENVAVPTTGGLAVMWSGFALVGLGDIWVLTRRLRR